jgi:hypothetical protein
MRHPIQIAGTRTFVYDGGFHDNVAGGGFASLSDLISEATTGGKRQYWPFQQTGSNAAVNTASSLWTVGNIPPVGSTPSALAGGSTCDRTTTGAVGQTNAGGGDTLHVTTGVCQGTTAPNTLLVYDRLWHGRPLLNTTSGQTVTYSTPRYATTTSPGNFAFIEVVTAISATAHNWTIVYTDQDGNTAQTTGAVAGVASAPATRIDSASLYFQPLATPDTGIRTITSLTLSATLAAGTVNLVHGHPLYFLPCLSPSGSMSVVDGINSAFNLVQVLDSACVCFIELKGVASACSYFGGQTMVSG